VKVGRFDSDAAALKQRIRSNERFGSADLNSWIFAELDVHAGMSVLDLGCGTGKQALPLSRIVGEDGRVTAIDISDVALAELRRQAADSGVSERIDTHCVGLDDLAEVWGLPTFDRAVSSYSLYYAREPKALLQNIHERLRPGGVMFVCGPAKDNNSELIAFKSALNGQAIPAASASAKVMEDDLPVWARDLFGEVAISTFENRVVFDSATAVHDYWSSHNLYDPGLDDAFQAAAANHFRSSNEFHNVKRAIGVRAVKSR
jgi:SAM-dependent methyltransferase